MKNALLVLIVLIGGMARAAEIKGDLIPTELKHLRVTQMKYDVVSAKVSVKLSSGPTILPIPLDPSSGPLPLDGDRAIYELSLDPKDAGDQVFFQMFLQGRSFNVKLNAVGQIQSVELGSAGPYYKK